MIGVVVAALLVVMVVVVVVAVLAVVFVARRHCSVRARFASFFPASRLF